MPRKRRTFSIDFKKEVVAQYLGGETLHRVARRHHFFAAAEPPPSGREPLRSNHPDAV